MEYLGLFIQKFMLNLRGMMYQAQPSTTIAMRLLCEYLLSSRRDSKQSALVYIYVIVCIRVRQKITLSNFNLTRVNSCYCYYRKKLLEIWAQIINFYRGRLSLKLCGFFIIQVFVSQNL